MPKYRMREFINIIMESHKLDESTSEVFWHGSPSGDLRGSHYGLHLGSHEAARQALESRIGVRADGLDWDGSTQYGKTLLAGSETLKRVGRWETGYNCGLPDTDFYAPDRRYKAKYSSSEEVSMDSRPSMDAFRIVGPMKNKLNRPLSDMGANNAMKRDIANGAAVAGRYYINDGEDPGSISVVVPDGSFVEKV
jgi:hypothetical protein